MVLLVYLYLLAWPLNFYTFSSERLIPPVIEEFSFKIFHGLHHVVWFSCSAVGRKSCCPSLYNIYFCKRGSHALLAAYSRVAPVNTSLKVFVLTLCGQWGRFCFMKPSQRLAFVTTWMAFLSHFRSCCKWTQSYCWLSTCWRGNQASCIQIKFEALKFWTAIIWRLDWWKDIIIFLFQSIVLRSCVWLYSSWVLLIWYFCVYEAVSIKQFINLSLIV